MDRESAALKYLPEKIEVLLVAEAPPNDAYRYFYFEDVSSHDHLFRAVSKVILGKTPNRASKALYLEELKKRGIFLIDLKIDPMDGSDLKQYVPDLLLRCRALNPRRIVLIKATVFDAAYHALVKDGLPVVDQRVYFPSTGRQRQFEEQFSKALASFHWNSVS